jgi:fibronectin type 3 domain-containing protein
MKKRHEIVSLLLVLFIALAVSSCSSKSSDGIPAPAAPSGVSAAAGDTAVTLSWDMVTGADSYTIYWGTSPGVTNADTAVINAPTSYTHTGLTNGTAYYYAVTAVNVVGASALSSEVSATPQAAIPGAPATVTAAAGDKQVTISWTLVTGATSYNVYWGTSTGVTTTTGTKIATVPSPYVHTGLTNGTTYYYVVTAVNTAGEGAESIEVAGTPALPGPGTPSATPGVQAITIQWSAIAGATSYNMYWSNSAGVTTASGTKITSVTSPYQHAGLSAGTYYYIVTAVGPGGETGASAVVTSPVNLLSFLTSETGNGNLSIWTSAAGGAGLAAADNVCQGLAIAEGLTGTFRAWLSDSTNDAYCRANNLNGKKGSNCGQASMPVSAGPWIRTDGTPFTGTIDNMVSPTYQVYSSARFDETGAEIAIPTGYKTATKTDGTLVSSGTDSSTCADWTTNSDPPGIWVTHGFSKLTASGLSTGVTGQCVSTSPLLCFQTDAGPALPIIMPVGKKVFATSTTGRGDLSNWTGAGANTGLAAGDAVCQTLAVSAGLTGTFKAWLSDSTTDAADRFTSNGPWARLDGIKVAASKTDLIDGTLFAPINLTIDGVYLSNHGVWTGSDDSGTKTANNCSDWGNDTITFNGTSGSAYKAGAGWAITWTSGCNGGVFRLYCLED